MGNLPKKKDLVTICLVDRSKLMDTSYGLLESRLHFKLLTWFVSFITVKSNQIKYLFLQWQRDILYNDVCMQHNNAVIDVVITLQGNNNQYSMRYITRLLMDIRRGGVQLIGQGGQDRRPGLLFAPGAHLTVLDQVWFLMCQWRLLLAQLRTLAVLIRQQLLF